MHIIPRRKVLIEKFNPDVAMEEYFFDLLESSTCSTAHLDPVIFEIPKLVHIKLYYEYYTLKNTVEFQINKNICEFLINSGRRRSKGRMELIIASISTSFLSLN